MDMDLLISPQELSVSYSLSGATAPRQKLAKKKTRKTNPRPRSKAKSISRPNCKHKTYLSATQIADRDEYAAFKSQELNLTLDMNDLRQIIQMLEQRRDLHVTRLMLTRYHFENDVLRMMERYFRVFAARTRHRTCSELTEFLSRVDPCMLASSMNGKGALPFFVWQWACYSNRFTHWKFRKISTRIVSFFEEGNVNDPNLVDGSGNIGHQVYALGGCVVESTGEFTGRPTRAMVAAMFPHLLSDEGYTAALTRQTIRFPTRIFAYFDARGNIVNHVLEADTFDALHAIVEANASSTEHIANGRFVELSIPTPVTAEGVDVEEMEPSESRLVERNYSGCESDGSSTENRHAINYLLN